MADFQARQNALDQTAAKLLEDYKTLQTEIQKSGQHYTNFRRLKETAFALEKVVKRNGGTLPGNKKERSATPPADLFKRKASTERSAAPPNANTPPNLFDRAANLKKREAAQAERQNPEPPNLFAKPAKPTAHPPLPGKKAKAPKDPKRKMLATSEEKDDE